MEKIKSEVVFGDEKIQASFDKLKNSKTENIKLHDFLVQAFEELENNPFCGIQIPKEYQKKFGPLTNL